MWFYDLTNDSLLYYDVSLSSKGIQIYLKSLIIKNQLNKPNYFIIDFNQKSCNNFNLNINLDKIYKILYNRPSIESFDSTVLLIY